MNTRAKLPDAPASTHNPKQRHGTMFNAPPMRRWQQGCIVKHNPQTQGYVVRTQFNGEQKDIPRLVRDEGEISILKPDTIVALHDELGFLVIDSVIKQAQVHTYEVAPFRVSEIRGIGGEDPVLTGDGTDANFRTPNDPVDLFGGDWVRRTESGNLVGVLEGGTNVIRSSPFSQIRTNQIGDLVEIYANAYKHISSMGNLTINNDNGRTSLCWRAGSNQTNENGSNAENWTLWMDAGANGDLFNFRITTPDGNTLCQIQMGADGTLSTVGVSGIDTTTAGDQQEDIGGDRNITVGGDINETATGDVNEIYGGTQTTTVTGNMASTIGGNVSSVVGGDEQTYVSGDDTQKISGSHRVEVINGGVETVIGNPLSGALPTGQGLAWVNYTGPYTFVVQPTAAAGGGGFTVVSALPSSVGLGCDGTAIYNPATGTHQIVAVPPPFGAALYEPLAAALNAISTWASTFTVITAMGPSAPGTLPPLAPLLEPLIPLIRSVRVGIGL